MKIDLNPKKIICYLMAISILSNVLIQSLYFIEEGCDKRLCYVWIAIGIGAALAFVILGEEK